MIFVTGASGFVGRRLCAILAEQGIAYRAAVRREAAAGQVIVGDLTAGTDWSAALAGCDKVIHLAARVHVMDESDNDPLRAYREVNVHGTLQLARQAAAAGVKRFVFVSSIKVNGEATGDKPFAPDDTPLPVDPYGVSKLEAEQALAVLGLETGMEIVVVRPPLVYGPGVKANFQQLIKLVSRGLPLPFGLVRGRRSMVALDNLCDLLILCCDHPRAAGGTFMVSDGADVTIGELVGAIARAMGRKRQRLLPVPPALMRGAATLLGRAAVADRLLGSLQVDMTSTQKTLEWSPIMSSQAAIDETVSAFLERTGGK